MRKLLSLALAMPLSAAAQTVQIVVPYAPGGAVDTVARIIARGLSEETKQPFVVENKPGANAAVGADYVARAPADGRTLLIGTAETHALNPVVRRKLSYDPLSDFTTVGIIDRFPFALVVSPKLPAASLQDFIAHAKKHDGKLSFASWGNGSISQFAFEHVKQATGIRMTHVPFSGVGLALSALAADTVQASIVPLSFARPPSGNGRAKLLAVMSAQREQAAPETPTATEQGVPVVISGWHILAAPGTTPVATVAALNKSLNTAINRGDIRDRLAKAGVQPVRSTPQEAQEMVNAEYKRWGEVARKAGINAE